jgi:hypothetical protein
MNRGRGTGGLVSRRRVLLALGAGLSGAGLTSTGAFSSVEGDRATLVGVEADPNGLLGLDGYADDTVTPTLTNNSSNQMSVTLDSPSSVEFDVDANGTYVAAPVTFSLGAGNTRPVDIKYTGSCTGAGSATVNKTADLLDGGNKVGEVTLSRTWQIPQSGQVNVTGNVKAAGNSGKYEFELENTGCFDVTLTGIGINETTNPAADNVGSQPNDDILTQGGQSIMSSQIPIDSTNPSSATVVGFDTTVDLLQNQTKTFEFNVFRDGTNKKVGMKGEDVKITLEFSDGSTSVTKLCLNGCSF